jgi:hypothetical protein
MVKGPVAAPYFARRCRAWGGWGVKMRVLFAFLIVPALLPLAYFGFLAATAGQSTIDADRMLSVVLPLSYMAVLGLGFPMHLLLNSVQLRRASSYVLGGLVISLLAYISYLDVLAANWRLWVGSVGGHNMAPMSHMLGNLVLWWAAGATTGALFWLMARPDREGRTASNLQAVLTSGMHRSAR